MRSLIYCILSFLVFTGSVFAVPVTCLLIWDAPTELEDGTPLDQDLLIGYRVYHSIDGPLNPDDSFVAVQNTQGREELTVNLDPRPDQSYMLRFGVIAVLDDGRVSAMSEVLVQEVLVLSSANPRPPTNLRIQLDCDNGGCIIEMIP